MFYQLLKRMSNIDTVTLEKHLKKTSLMSNSISLFIALVTALSVGYGFYYNTRSTLQVHTEKIENVEKDVHGIDEKINQIEVYKGVSQSEINELKSKVDKMDEKLDRILIQTSK